jgi:hypothetical protein
MACRLAAASSSIGPKALNCNPYSLVRIVPYFSFTSSPSLTDKRRVRQGKAPLQSDLSGLTTGGPERGNTESGRMHRRDIRPPSFLVARGRRNPDVGEIGIFFT